MGFSGVALASKYLGAFGCAAAAASEKSQKSDNNSRWWSPALRQVSTWAKGWARRPGATAVAVIGARARALDVELQRVGLLRVGDDLHRGDDLALLNVLCSCWIGRKDTGSGIIQRRRRQQQQPQSGRKILEAV